MSLKKHLPSLLIYSTLSWCALGIGPAAANEKAGAGGAYTRIEPITVNLAGGAQYLQVSVSIKGGAPEFGAVVTERMPFVRHEMILLLSSQTSEEISTVQGKKVLMDRLKGVINKATKLGGHDGVAEVLFEAFIIQ
jgi:flagellar FliL protein